MKKLNKILLYMNLTVLAIIAIMYMRPLIFRSLSVLQACVLVRTKAARLSRKKDTNMGNPVRTSRIVYGIDSPYFEAGHTPKIMKATFAGIIITDGVQGELWASPLNTTIHMQQVDASSWAWFSPREPSDPKYTYVIFTLNDNGTWKIVISLGEIQADYHMFWGIGVIGESWQAENHYPDSLYDYYGYGVVNIHWYDDSTPLSVIEMSLTSGMSVDDDSFLEVLPQSLTEAIYRYSRKKDASSIHVRVSP